MLGEGVEGGQEGGRGGGQRGERARVEKTGGNKRGCKLPTWAGSSSCKKENEKTLGRPARRAVKREREEIFCLIPTWVAQAHAQQRWLRGSSRSCIAHAIHVGVQMSRQ